MQYRVLGPLEVEDDGELVKLAGPKQRALLASLLLHANRTVSRDCLVDELWGERAPRTAAHRLEEHVSRLRKLLHANGEAPLVTRPGGYMLRISREALDVSQFEVLVSRGRSALEDGRLEEAAAQLREALALWRGPPLQELAELARPEIRQLEEQRVVAHKQLMEAELGRGRHAEVLPELEALVDQEPLRERFRALLMLALYRSGRQADALAVFQAARQTLTEELGIEPGRELRDLEQAILRQDASLELFEPDGRPLPPPVPRASAGNLPRPATSLVGREREIGEVLALIANGARFVTLTGPGGSGKTRLALEAANRAVADFPDGVFWVALAAIRDPALVLESVMQTVGTKEDIAAHIGDRRLLLLIDNFEHVIPAARQLSSLIAVCPSLYVLVTSRELLRVTAETEYAVLPLTDSEAIELFCVRGRAQTGPAVAELCHRLDNLPLAIEFAAARTAVLSPRQMLERISQRLDVLKGRTDAESRQRTLRTTLEWSYDLLSAEERLLFANLAVFAGGWTLLAAEQVASANLDTLQSLVEKSLIQHVDERFSMLETTREFALEQLAAVGSDEIRRGHAMFYTALAESVEPEKTRDWHEPLAAELGNLRSSLTFAEIVVEPELLLRLSAALGRFWLMYGLLQEGRGWLEKGLAGSTGPAAARARALSYVSRLAAFQGDDAAARRYAEEELVFAQSRGDELGVVSALNHLGNAALYAADFDRARTLYQESELRARATQSPTHVASAVGNLANLELTAGSFARALDLSDRAAGLFDDIGDLHLKAVNLGQSASAARELGRLELAAERLGEAIRISKALGGARLYALLQPLAALEARRGRFERAARLLGAVEALQQRAAAGLEPFERIVGDRTEAILNEAMDGATFAGQRALGAGMTIEEILNFALEAD